MGRSVLGVHVQFQAAELVDPTRHVAIAICIHSAFIAAPSNAKDVAGSDFRDGCERRHLSTVDDLQFAAWSHEVFGHPREDVDDLLLVHIRRHVREDLTLRRFPQIGHRACHPAADCVDLRELPAAHYLCVMTLS